MSYQFSINGVTLADKLFGNTSNVSIANAFRNIGKHFEDVAIGAVSEYVILNSGPAKGTGTITIATGNMSDSDTITINSVVLTAKTSPSGTAQFKVGSSAIKTAYNLTACISANPSLGPIVSASVVKSSTSGVVTITAINSGTVGNYTWSQSGSNVTLSPSSAMAGGASGPVSASNVFTITSSNLSAADTVKVGMQTFTAESSGATGPQFNVGGSALITAQNLAAAINAYTTTGSTFSAVASAGAASAGLVTVTVLMPGQIGNHIPVTKSATNGSWAHTTFFVSGTDSSVVTLHKGL